MLVMSFEAHESDCEVRPCGTLVEDIQQAVQFLLRPSSHTLKPSPPVLPNCGLEYTKPFSRRSVKSVCPRAAPAVYGITSSRP